MRNIQFVNDEYYHIYNRGVDKRELFSEKNDLFRFLDSLQKLNTQEPSGGLYEIFLNKGTNNYKTIQNREKCPLVEFVAYCINPNHYHFILKQITDDGISKFMHRFSTGYTKYFNEKYKRTGPLFSGRYKAKHINSDDYLLNISAYVNLNYLIHGIHVAKDSFISSSWEQYVSNNNIQDGRFSIPCGKEMILEQVGGPVEYKKFAQEYKQLIIGLREEEDKDGFIDNFPRSSTSTNRRR